MKGGEKQEIFKVKNTEKNFKIKKKE